MEANNDTAINFELLAERRDQEAARDKLDAQRYRKLKLHARESHPARWSSLQHVESLDAEVDALPNHWGK